MPKVIAFRSKGKGRKRTVYPITEGRGIKIAKGLRTEQQYRQAVKTHTRRGRTVVAPEGFHFSISYSIKDQYGLQKSLAHYEKRGYETVVLREGNRIFLYYKKPGVPRVIVKPKPKEPKIKEKIEKPKKEPKRLKIPKKKRPPPTKMTHIEKMHLLAASKRFNIDPYEIDNTLTYYENKKHIQELAKEKGYSEHEITSMEQESKQWASEYSEYLSHLRTELESAGYRVSSPNM